MVEYGKAERGFTLIELSIVLVVIGLIVGGVLVGQSLIFAAQLRKVGTEVQQFATAFHTFRVKYDCIPGDCANAQQMLGTDGNGCPNGGGGGGTCNGNGDGQINSRAANGNVESLYVWNQLSLAHFIPFNPIGQGGTSSTITITPGTNVPATSFDPNIGYHALYLPNGLGGSMSTSALQAKNQLQIGEISSPVGSCGTIDLLQGAGFTGPVAQALDTKFDDGSPSGGGLIATGADCPGRDNLYTSCVSGTSYSAATASGCLLYYQKLE